MRGLARLTAAATAALVVPVLPAAAADGPSGSANYACGHQDVNVTLTLDTPVDSVKPGENLRLRGTLTFGFTSQMTLLTRVLLTSRSGVSSADFSIEANTADRHDEIPAVAVQGDPTRLGQVMSLDARTLLADYTVPADATGDVLLALPKTFSVTLAQNGLIAQRALSCELASADGAVPAITRIPVQPRVAATGSGSGDAGPALPPPGSTTGSGPASLTEPTPADPGSATSAATARPVFAAVPPSTRSGGVVIPYWSIALVGLVVPLASVVFALSLRRRMRVMQRADEIAASNRALARGRGR